MRLLKKSISAKDGEGFAHLLPEVPEDLWHAYNLLAVGDLLTAPTVRKVVKDGAGGATKSKRVTTKLTIEVRLRGPALPAAACPHAFSGSLAAVPHAVVPVRAAYRWTSDAARDTGLKCSPPDVRRWRRSISTRRRRRFTSRAATRCRTRMSRWARTTPLTSRSPAPSQSRNRALQQPAASPRAVC